MKKQSSIDPPESASLALRDGNRQDPHRQPIWRYTCILQMFDIPLETRLDTMTPAALEMDRPQCEGTYIEWNPAFTPKEHVEMMDRQRLLQWQREMEEGRREHEKVLAKYGLWGLIIAGASATASVIAAVVAVIVVAN